MISYEEYRASFSALSNWGRWGPDDELGTLNFITPEATQRAAQMVRDGVVVTCGRPLSTVHSVDNPQPLMHFMLSGGEGAPAEGASAAGDWFAIAPHGFVTTHLDSLAHYFWDGRLYNGRPANVVSTRDGAAFGSIVPAASAGIVTRGVLADLPASLGVDQLEPGTAVTPDMLTGCLAQQGVDVLPGDALLYRTGRDPASMATGAQTGRPGLHPSCLPWLREREISVLATDWAHDVHPSVLPQVRSPIHMAAIVAMGLWLLDNVALEDLARECAARRRWEFLFSVMPLPVETATASPVCPLAIL